MYSNSWNSPIRTAERRSPWPSSAGEIGSRSGSGAKSGEDETVSLPPTAAALVQAVLGRLLRGERVAVLAEDKELSPNDAAGILGVSRPSVVHRMEIGDLPFRYVGKHRRARLKDVLALKIKIDAQQAVMAALAEDAEDLEQRYGV